MLLLLVDVDELEMVRVDVVEVLVDVVELLLLVAGQPMAVMMVVAGLWCCWR